MANTAKIPINRKGTIELPVGDNGSDSAEAVTGSSPPVFAASTFTLSGSGVAGSGSVGAGVGGLTFGGPPVVSGGGGLCLVPTRQMG